MPTTEPFRTQYQGKWRTQKHSKQCFQEKLLGSSLLKIFKNLRRRKWDRHQRSQVRLTHDGRTHLQQVLELEEREMIIMKSCTPLMTYMPLNKATSAASCLLTKNNSIGVEQESIKRIWKYHNLNQDTSSQVLLPFLFCTFQFRLPCPVFPQLSFPDYFPTIVPEPHNPQKFGVFLLSWMPPTHTNVVFSPMLGTLTHNSALPHLLLFLHGPPLWFFS